MGPVSRHPMCAPATLCVHPSSRCVFAAHGVPCPAQVTVAFDQRSVTNVKLALTDDKFTYEPSYNLIKKAPSLAVSRSLGPGKYKFGWNLKTDDLALEYIWKVGACVGQGNCAGRRAARMVSCSLQLPQAAAEAAAECSGECVGSGCCCAAQGDGPAAMARRMCMRLATSPPPPLLPHTHTPRRRSSWRRSSAPAWTSPLWASALSAALSSERHQGHWRQRFQGDSLGSCRGEPSGCWLARQHASCLWPVLFFCGACARYFGVYDAWGISIYQICT